MNLLILVGVIPLLLVLAPLAHAQFVANPTNKTSATINTADPNYSTYQNLGLGFSIKYFKNMTISEQTDNRSAFATSHKLAFTSPHPLDFKGLPHLRDIRILVVPSTGAFGIPMSLDDAARQILLTLVGNITITSKTKGNLNGLPAYEIKLEGMGNPVNYANTTTTIPLHLILYLTVKNQILYGIEFTTFDKNVQSNFIPMVNKLIGTFKYN
jgi:PsbP-like protein